MKADTAQLSRQLRWHRAQKKKGNCTVCGKPAQWRVRCDKCAKRHGHVKYRKPLKSAWAAVNWDKPDTVIAAHFGVTRRAVVYQRRKRAPSPE